MPERFRSFVIFAGMRTGSNLLEATLNAIKKVTCFGEAFNPYMMGWPEKTELQGLTFAEREADPHALLRKLSDKPGHLPGFRYFHDHDPRIFDAIIENRDCAKIVLTRNPLDSYVSTELARAMNQWKLNETETPIPARITFDAHGFNEMAGAVGEFHHRISRALQHSGQAAFWLSYDDLRDPDVMTGLLHWLGRTDLEKVMPAQDQVPQNPREMSEKVENFDAMKRDLQQGDPFDLGRIPNFESTRGPAVPSFQAVSAGRGLVHMPVKGGPMEAIGHWLAEQGEVTGDFTQNSLRQWKRKHAGHRSFTVLRHPVLRAWEAFTKVLAATKPDLRQVLRDVHRVSLPSDDSLASMSPEAQAQHFTEFLIFLRRNLNAQTSLPTHPRWASQSEVLAGFARFGTPDAVLREDRLERDLMLLAESAGLDRVVELTLQRDQWPEFLTEPSIVEAARSAYQRDYIAFGFSDQPDLG